MKFINRYKEIYNLNKNKNVMAFYLSLKAKEIATAQIPFAIYGLARLFQEIGAVLKFYRTGGNALSTSMDTKLQIATDCCAKLLSKWNNTVEYTEVQAKMFDTYRMENIKLDEDAFINDLPENMIDVINTGVDAYTLNVAFGKLEEGSKPYNTHYSLEALVYPINNMLNCKTILALCPHLVKNDIILRKNLSVVISAVESMYKYHIEQLKLLTLENLPKIYNKHFN